MHGCRRPPRAQHDRPRRSLNPAVRQRMRLGLRLGGGAAGLRRVPPEPGVTDPPRTTTNETRTETRSAVASNTRLGPQRPTLPMTARRKTWHRRLDCTSATNPVAPGTASVFPPRKGYARLTRIEFETIYSAAEGA